MPSKNGPVKSAVTRPWHQNPTPGPLERAFLALPSDIVLVVQEMPRAGSNGA
jgi:hypothetical protein